MKSKGGLQRRERCRYLRIAAPLWTVSPGPLGSNRPMGHVMLTHSADHFSPDFNPQPKIQLFNILGQDVSDSTER